jgi:hypothetical protein
VVIIWLNTIVVPATVYLPRNVLQPVSPLTVPSLSSVRCQSQIPWRVAREGGAGGHGTWAGADVWASAD